MALRIGMDIGSDTVKTVIIRDGDSVQELPILSIQGQPLRRVKEALEEALKVAHQSSADGEPAILGVTGAGAPGISELTGAERIDEPIALAASIDRLYPDVRTVVEMGREGQKYILFERDEVSGKLLMADSNLGNKCAAGSGSFLDHMTKRLNFSHIDEFARVALETVNPASLSGRCSVFTESDIVHLYQKGTPRERIAAGIHQAICRNYRSCFARGKQFKAKVAFIGGVSENPAAVKYLADELKLNGELFVPEHNRTLGAIGAALRAVKPIDLQDAVAVLDEKMNRPIEYVSTNPLKFELSEILPPPTDNDIPTDIAVAALGVDIGSVSTKAALVTEIDGKFHVLASHYRRTDGDPLAAVCDTLSKIHDQIKENSYNIGKIYAATTGSGRYLTGDYIGADLIKNEITAQANGAITFIDDVEGILEIGGQDSKFIRMNGEVITDFEMNKACAAGCGAFLEKQAARLDIPIAEFGDHALKGKRPPDLDWTCTVFTESAMVYFQQAGVPVEDLCAAVCIASVKNYMNKNIGSRDIGKKIVFQGAVAFNKGMVAAYETVLGQKIVVPPYPHLTGAIGAARLAFKNHPEQSRFVGFDKVVQGNYVMGSFECKACPNACDVNTFQVEGGPKYYYNDRCEKYSAIHKKKLGENLPDLFEEREQMLFKVYDKKAPAGAPRIGVPRGLMFADYFPLYNAFLTELGFEVVPSDRTNRRIVELGLTASIGEPCYPYKVTHGHYVDLIEKGVDMIFSPGILSAEKKNPNLGQAQTCPYLQAAPEVIATNTGISEKGIKYITPRIHFMRGRKHLNRVFSELAVQLGKTKEEGLKALEVGLDVLQRFRAWQDERGKEILDSLGPNDTAFVIIGRPYSLYDNVINMDIGKKVQDLGILAIPQDFIPLDSVDISDAWPNAYSRQIQKKICAGRIIRQDKRLRAVVLTYFGCGPDSFANPFFKDEINEPCYVMQLDEHTADAGVITRIEAFADTAMAVHKAKDQKPIRTEDLPITRLAGRKLWIPYASDSARMLAAVLRAYGIDSDALPRSPDKGLNLARKAISEDVCLPALVTTEDILYRVSQPGFDSTKEAFFQGNAEGPCRFGMYYMLQRRILDKLGLESVDLVTLGSKSEHGGLGTHFAIVAWDALVAHDMLQKMLHHARPYEVNQGESDALFEKYIQQICKMMPEHKRRIQDGWGRFKSLFGKSHLGPILDVLHLAQRDFANIPKSDEKRPLVGVVGEFFVRIHDGANQNIVRKIEACGGEAWLAPATEFFGYANYIDKILSRERWLDTGDKSHLVYNWTRSFNHKLAMREEHAMFHACQPFLADLEDIGPAEVIDNGTNYVHYTFGGEAICSMGKSEDFAQRGLAGIVSVIPFNCMPGNIVTALSQALRKRHNNMPFLNLDYDGFIDSSRDAKVANFMWQVKERWAGQREKQAALHHTDE
ncbi:MAG: acyl-CoA dehydratase activase [Armatimonadota bacterium]